jgi:hypothetical protein
LPWRWASCLLPESLPGGPLIADHRRLDPHFSALPLIAILRGVTAEEAVAIGEAVVEAGFRVVGVPLNSPRPLESIRRLVEAIGDRARTGAGTVLTVQQVHDVAAAGGTLIVSPNANPDVIRATKAAASGARQASPRPPKPSRPSTRAPTCSSFFRPSSWGRAS